MISFLRLLVVTFFIFSGAFIDAQLAKVLPGIDVLFESQYSILLKGKRIGLITNQTAVDGNMQTTIDLMRAKAPLKGYVIAALFAPEHGLTGSAHADEKVDNPPMLSGIPIYSLYGKTQRPTDEMLKGINLLVFDIQDIGSRSYTYIATLFFVMEEAAKRKIPIVVLDRPNPINGIVVDGPMLEDKWRSIVGYINVPYCHGMTIGELAHYFNDFYKVNCELTVVPMRGWKREMSFQETGLPWVPTSPQVPEGDTPFYYPMTGILGEISIVNIGVGYTLPFKIVGAPWIDAKGFAKQLNAQNFPGVYFHPFSYKPFYGKFSNTMCQGVLIVVTNHLIFKPVSTQYLIIGVLKSLYPQKFKEALDATKNRKQMFCKVNGTELIYNIIHDKPYVVWELIQVHQKEREQFLINRKPYLLY